MKILIVDDELANIALLQRALEDSYEICTATNGFDAIGLFAAQAPDLVLLDVMMPQIDGFEVCRRIRTVDAREDTPIIFITVLSSLESQLEGLELGAVDYITKPINLKLAKLRIRNQINCCRQRNLLNEKNELLTLQKAELQATLSRVKSLEGFLSICMQCKSIRAQNQDWQRIENYLNKHSDAVFSHGLCPKCLDKEMRKLD